MTLRPFTLHTTPTIRFGPGALADLGGLAAGLGRRALVVTDPGLARTDIVGRAEAVLRRSGVEVARFDGVQADPPEATVLAAAEAARAAGAECVVGIGGGSSLDAAKLAAVLAAGADVLGDIYGIGKVRGPRLPLVLAPTTAGTGSEVTPIAIVTTGSSEKLAVVSPLLLPDVALVDPELTHGLPPHVTAATGIDAMVHAIEAHASINPNNNPASRALAREALTLIGTALETAVHDGANAAARATMALGALLAGQAFANSPVAAVHALAYPIGARFHVPHGLSNALVLPHVLRFNVDVAPALYAEIAPCAFPALAALEGRARADAFCDALAELSRRCGLPGRLRDAGIPRDALALLARDAMNQGRLLGNNPRPVTEAGALAIYAAAW